jgi:hypothetical protein
MTSEEKLDKILSEVDQIKRGLYGDAVNKVPGLMQDHYELKTDVKKLKDGRKKIMWVSAGFIAAVQAIWFYLKEIAK